MGVDRQNRHSFPPDRSHCCEPPLRGNVSRGVCDRSSVGDTPTGCRWSALRNSDSNNPFLLCSKADRDTDPDHEKCCQTDGASHGPPDRARLRTCPAPPHNLGGRTIYLSCPADGPSDGAPRSQSRATTPLPDQHCLQPGAGAGDCDVPHGDREFRSRGRPPPPDRLGLLRSRSRGGDRLYVEE